MTKREIAAYVSEKTGAPQVLTQRIIQHTLDYITQAVSQEKSVELRKFGVFKVKRRRHRVGRNPRTGQTVTIPERKTVIFKPGKLMKESLS